jgi:hypothetical protein
MKKENQFNLDLRKAGLICVVMARLVQDRNKAVSYGDANNVKNISTIQRITNPSRRILLHSFELFFYIVS